MVVTMVQNRWSKWIGIYISKNINEYRFSNFIMKKTMTKIDPIIAGINVESSTLWYQEVFGFKKNHGAKDFAVLVSEDN